MFLKENWVLNVDLKFEKKRLEYGRELYEILRDYEKSHGVNDLLALLATGLKISCEKNSNKKLEMLILFRTPSDSGENEELFKEMIISWVEENPLSFSERFFRLPKVSEDIADRYLDNPLEQALKRKFGFHFLYKLIIKCEKDGPDIELLRKKLYRTIAD
jgi:hypothetical protein